MSFSSLLTLILGMLSSLPLNPQFGCQLSRSQLENYNFILQVQYQDRVAME